jgi:hypothetical protein
MSGTTAGSGGVRCAHRHPTNAGSMPTIQRLQLADQLIRHVRTIAIEHAGVIGVEQGVFDAGEAGALAALDDDGVPAVDHVEDGHAVDR